MNEGSLTLLIKTARHMREPRSVDFQTLLTPELCGMSLNHAEQLLSTHGLPSAVCPHRIALIRATHAYCDDKLTSGVTGSQVYRDFLAMRGFLSFTSTNLSFPLTLDSAPEALRQYNNYWKNRVNSGKNSQNTASSYLLSVSRILAEACNTPWEELRLKIDLVSQARYNPPETNQSKAIQGFVQDLSDIINAVKPESLLSRDVIHVHFRRRDDYKNISIRLSRHGIPPQSELPYLHIQAVQLRIIAELKRFVALTGMNPAVVERLQLKDIKFESASGRLRAVQFKVRAGKKVAAEVPSSYIPLLRQHIDFIQSLPRFGDQPSLFPALVADSDRKSDPITAWRDSQYYSHRAIAAHLKKAGRPNFNGRALRRNKGVYALRKSGGDALIAARILGNTPTVAAKHYGGQGNRAENEVEMTAYFQSVMEASQQRLSRSTDPGLCAEPKAPQRASDAPEEIAPQCGAANSCLFCTKYRAIETPDYIHEILTLRYQLRMREGGSQHHVQTLQMVKRINQILEQYSALSEAHAGDVRELSAMVDAGRFHRLHQNSIELQEVLGA